MCFGLKVGASVVLLKKQIRLRTRVSKWGSAFRLFMFMVSADHLTPGGP